MKHRTLWIFQPVFFALLLLVNPVNAQPEGYKDLTLAPSGEYKVDKTHAYITFSYLHQGYSRPWLRFRNVDATLTLNAKDISKSAVLVTIDAASIDSGIDVFDQHLRDEKMFDTSKFPDIQFQSTSIAADKNGQLQLIGDLTMKGITKSVTLDIDFNKGGLHFKTKKPVIGFSASGTLMRSDWGLGYGVPMVGDKINLVIEVEFHQA